MIRYLYDGSFEGFLCAVSTALSDAGKTPLSELSLSAAGPREGELFSTDVPVVTDLGRARAFRGRVASAVGREELEAVLLAHSSRDPSAPGLLLKYIALLFEAGSRVADNLSIPEVLAVRKIRDRVMYEINKFLGILRFRKVAEGLFYAPVNPDSNIVGFLGPHFSDRFRDQAFLIHDVNRGTAFLHDAGTGIADGIVDLSGMPRDLFAALEADGEPLIPSLWREYFHTIAIRERRNPSLQAKNLPRRYWRYLTEMEGRPGFEGVHSRNTAGGESRHLTPWKQEKGK